MFLLKLEILRKERSWKGEKIETKKKKKKRVEKRRKKS